MNPFKRAKRRQKLLSGESGQMAVFIALIFQVLFVFFAMVVNVGLIIHDKINLQNSVDLAAYYAAAKQAEQLNEIAHINYQIRQDYKLLAWRLRVLGNFGRDMHPLTRAYYNQSVTDTDDSPQKREFADYPSVCITHSGWLETRALAGGSSGVENLCRQRPGIDRIPELKTPPVIFPSPGNVLINIQIEEFRQRFQNRCRDAGPLNWQFTGLANLGYRRAIMIRKEMIKSIANNLSAPLKTSQGSFADRAGDLVATGMEKTFRKNLTKANKESVVEIEGFNGLNSSACLTQTAEGTPNWLREVLIYPTITYTDFTGSGGDCAPQVASLESPITALSSLIPFDASGDLRRFTQGEPEPRTNYHSTRGFEKNPWCMAYVGIKAETAPRKPFAPFGQPIRLTARAFAMPFGGRVGPWDKETWSPNADFSDGVNQVDPVAAPRYFPNVFLDRSEARNIPNYARYPGDQLGLRSSLALSATMPSLYAPTVRDGSYYTLSNYRHLARVEQHGDVLPWNSENPNQVPALRKIEAAAVAPDLFDATYYSVEPNYYGYYFKGLNQARFSNNTPIGDLGNRKDNPLFVSYSVKNQVADTYPGGADTGALLRTDIYWMIRKPEHLLTSWSPNGPNDFSVPNRNFGRCLTDPPNGQQEPATIGDCIAGGRTGYSVQLVSKDYLMSDRHSLGGANTPPGAIRNKPDVGF